MTMTVRERVVLDRLKEFYEASGYQFFAEPSAQLLPSGLGNLRPDAIAIRDDEKLIIEVKGRDSEGFKNKIRNFSSALNDETSNWKLVVFPLDTTGSLGMDSPGASHADVKRIAAEARSLHRVGHHAAALLLGWGGLEALARKLAADHGELQRVALGPGKAIDYLEQMGELLEPEARALRHLVPIRNALSHGLYGEIEKVGPEESETLLNVIDSLLEHRK